MNIETNLISSKMRANLIDEQIVALSYAAGKTSEEIQNSSKFVRPNTKTSHLKINSISVASSTNANVRKCLSPDTDDISSSSNRMEIGRLMGSEF